MAGRDRANDELTGGEREIGSLGGGRAPDFAAWDMLTEPIEVLVGIPRIS